MTGTPNVPRLEFDERADPVDVCQVSMFGEVQGSLFDLPRDEGLALLTAWFDYHRPRWVSATERRSVMRLVPAHEVLPGGRAE